MACVIRILPTVLIAAAAASAARAQLPPPPLSGVEPGLEKAVRWKWHPEPTSLADWGLQIHVEEPAPVSGVPGTTAPSRRDPTGRPDSYVVQKGDALAIIGRRFNVPVDLLKQVNGLTSNLIRVGQVLRIPTPAEVAAHSPPPVTPKPAGPALPGLDDAQQADTLTLQVYLDRAQFSGGPIDGQITPAFLETIQAFTGAYPEFQDSNVLLETARRTIRNPLVRYTLRAQDFRFIAPPKAQAVGSKSKGKSDEAPKPTFDDMLTSRMLAYRSPWEFVAERFHCSEKFLRQLNPEIKGVPAPGAEFWVPAVAPFEIERALIGSLQPLSDPKAPVTASIVGLTRLEIRQADKLIAALPVSIARPGLRGRDSWTILVAIPRPELVTSQELRNTPQAPTRIYGRESSDKPAPTPTPAPETLVLGPGPRNPVGVVWINLAKTPDSEPLPFGLHGTSIPDEMATHESLGGIRMTNWDISRAVRLLPPGTPLVWAENKAAPAAPAPPL